MLAGTLSYNAQSPDEAALVSAARNFGYVFRVSSVLHMMCSDISLLYFMFCEVSCMSM